MTPGAEIALSRPLRVELEAPPILRPHPPDEIREALLPRAEEVRRTGRGSAYTQLVKFDDQWRRLESWSFPAAVVERFKPMSSSGGAWGADGRLYVTGHDHPELYFLA